MESSDFKISAINHSALNWLDQVRVDQNLFLNLPDIEATFHEDSPLVRDFIIFLAHNYKVDLFGFTHTTVAEFSTIMKHNKTNLQRIHRKFKKDGKVLESSEIPKIGKVEMKSNFDYILYRLYTHKIILSRTKTTKVPSLNIVHSTSIEVISDLNIFYDPKKPDRRIYQLKLNSKFLENILNFYVTISLKDYLNVGTNWDNGRHKSLYLYLAGSKHTLRYQDRVNEDGHYVLTPNFDLLCQNIGIDETIKEPKHKKAKLKKYLDFIQEKTDLNFTYKFFVGTNQKQAYSLEIYMQKEALVFEGEAKNKFFKNLHELLRQFYVTTYPNYKDSYEHYQRWLTNKQVDSVQKQSIIESSAKHAKDFIFPAKDELFDIEYLKGYYLNNTITKRLS